jgi:predicted site-specific integrase-resolvase
MNLRVDGLPMWLTPKEAAGLLACGRNTLRIYRQQGKIRIRHTPRGHSRYWRDDILLIVKPT